jgi:hypothetical protein
VFFRIPKTASSTIVALFAKFEANKSTSIIDLGELEDLVPSLPRDGANVNTQGYVDEKLFPQRIRAFYEKASRTILYPPFSNQDRTFFHGHLHFFNYTRHAQRLAPQPSYAKFLSRQLRAWYNLEPPSEEAIAKIQQMVMLRKPQDRLASMYYYDRHDARNDAWRSDFVKQRGNVTLEACLLDDRCVQVNELKRWCSIQTEMICGHACAGKPVTEESLATAITNLKNHIAFGITDRLSESLSLFEHQFPTYLEGLGNLIPSDIPREKEGHAKRREASFSTESQEVLDGLCYLDNQIYLYANDLLTERLEACRGSY